MHRIPTGSVPCEHPHTISLPGPTMHTQLLFPRLQPERIIIQVHSLYHSCIQSDDTRVILITTNHSSVFVQSTRRAVDPVVANECGIYAARSISDSRSCAIKLPNWASVCTVQRYLSTFDMSYTCKLPLNDAIAQNTAEAAIINADMARVLSSHWKTKHTLYIRWVKTKLLPIITFNC